MCITNDVFVRHPGTVMGAMIVSGLGSPSDAAAWNKLKNSELDCFKARWMEYDRKKALQTAPLSGYASYYKQFKKTYPVLLQMESILQKGREIKATCLSVEAMFLAEVKHGVLVAGHDLDQLTGADYTVKLARGGEELTVVSGQTRILKDGDIFLENSGKILSSVLEGADYDTRLTDSSQRAIYYAYGVGGVTAAHLEAFFLTLSLYLKTALPGAAIGDWQITSN